MVVEDDQYSLEIELIGLQEQNLVKQWSNDDLLWLRPSFQSHPELKGLIATIQL